MEEQPSPHATPEDGSSSWKPSLVIWDLDGTLIDTESLVMAVARSVVESHGQTLTVEAARAGIGRRPLDAWQATADILGIDKSAQELYDQSEPLLEGRWHEAPLLPGAARLLRHLQQHGVRMALATSTPRATLERKLSSKDALRAAFGDRICCGDEVPNGKPAPDCFIEVARRLGVAASECLVIEDAPSGVAAACAAGMRVVVIPSLGGDGGGAAAFPPPVPGAPSGCIRVLPSLLELRPQEFGLPPFDDTVAGTVPMHPVLRLAGPVVKGFGRGSRQLGIPTANVDPASLAGTLAEAVTGIYAGWASVGDSPEVHKMAMSIGYNPVFKNKEKTAEPWLLHEFQEDFYGETIRLVICAYIRPEANFSSVEALVERIHADADVAREALEQPPYAELRGDPFLRPPPPPPPAGETLPCE